MRCHWGASEPEWTSDPEGAGECAFVLLEEVTVTYASARSGMCCCKVDALLSTSLMNSSKKGLCSCGSSASCCHLSPAAIIMPLPSAMAKENDTLRAVRPAPGCMAVMPMRSRRSIMPRSAAAIPAPLQAPQLMLHDGMPCTVNKVPLQTEERFYWTQAAQAANRNSKAGYLASKNSTSSPAIGSLQRRQTELTPSCHLSASASNEEFAAA